MRNVRMNCGLVAAVYLTMCGGYSLAQSPTDDAKANLEAIYGLYHLGQYCRDQGLGFTDVTLNGLKEAAKPYEAALADDAAENKLWEDAGATAGFMVSMMSMDKNLASTQCGQLGASVHNLTTPSRTKPF